ncbi:hypothetical protein BS333_03765 [Vibrio azureus]|nr:hypothetical protein BS333_03765 [Vibrio azureus]
MKLKYIVLASLIANVAHASENNIDKDTKTSWGTVQQIECVKIEQPVNRDLLVYFNQSVHDWRSSDSKLDVVVIPSGETGEFCSGKFRDELDGIGDVNTSWTIKDMSSDEHKTVASFKTHSYFDGKGDYNDWDIDERGLCASEETENDYDAGGVYLENNNQKTCGFIEGVPDEKTMKAVFVPDLSNLDNGGDHGYPHYSAREVMDGESDWQLDQVIYAETTDMLYICKAEELCNQLPSLYSPGAGGYWYKAWDRYNEPK